MDKVDPAIIVIFGITGDLAQRKLLPALYHLFRDNLIDEKTIILGITRRDISTEDMIVRVEKSIRAAEAECDPAILTKVQSALRMHTMSQVDPSEYQRLKQLLDEIEAEKGVCMDRLFYLSIPPQMFEPIVRNLGQQGLNQSCQHGTAATRLLIEKPFGYNLASAQELINETGEWFREEQIFRIDHYIAKDAVQNILAFRRQYPEVEKLWNDQQITRIEITVFEKLDIEGRAVFYEETGALRDFVQSHLLQMLALTTMELPDTDTSQAIHAKRTAALQAIVPIRADTVNAYAERGQYEGYREEVDNPNSFIETFARLHLLIPTERWQSTEIILETGKAMSEKTSHIRLFFEGGAELTFHIQPEEYIELANSDDALQPIEAMIEEFNHAHPPTNQNPLGYERVFRDAIRGNHTLFTTSEEVLAAWKVVNEVVEVWGVSGDGLVLYPKGAKSVPANSNN